MDQSNRNVSLRFKMTKLYFIDQNNNSPKLKECNLDFDPKSYIHYI